MSRRKSSPRRPIQTWLEGLRAECQRPMVRLVVNRDGRTAAYAFDVDDETDIDELAGRIDTVCRNAGFKGYELHALGPDGRVIDSETVELIVSHERARAARTTSEDALALHALSEAARLRGQLLTALQTERMLLLQAVDRDLVEGTELRRLLAQPEELKVRETAARSTRSGPGSRKLRNRRCLPAERRPKSRKPDPEPSR